MSGDVEAQAEHQKWSISASNVKKVRLLFWNLPMQPTPNNQLPFSILQDFGQNMKGQILVSWLPPRLVNLEYRSDGEALTHLVDDCSGEYGADC